MKIVIAGESPFVEELTALCVEANHDTTMYLVEDFLSAIQSGYLLDKDSSVEVVIELHNESAAAKQELLLAISEAVPQRALLLTSALASSATQAAAWVTTPERVVGFGIISPLGPEKMVELAEALQTDEQSFDRAVQFWQALNFKAVKVADGAGLVRARILCCLINEAIGALMEGVASAGDIDRAMKLGTNYPLGPLEWADHLGLDTVLGVMTGLHAEWGDDRYRPSPLLRRLVQAGRLGKKTGRGIYDYQSD